MQEAIDSMDLEQFKKFERNFTLLDLKETSFNRPKVQLTSIGSTDNSNNSEQDNSSNKNWWQTIKEFKDQYIKTALELNITEQELRKAQLAQYGLALNKAKSVYNKYVLSPKSRANLSRPFSILDQVQSFPTKLISNNDLAISSEQQQQLKSSSPWMYSILSFPGDLLFGQMAYADEMLQSTDGFSSSNIVPQQEGTWSVLKKARDGDPNAQLEMRRRFPIGAEASERINNDYKAWNDPILGFKNRVHNILGASWFLPGSMDDLGEVCLNSAMAIGGVSTIPKIAEGYRKVQVAYQAYKTTQGFKNRLPSDRIQHEAAKTLYRQQMEKPPIQNKDPILREVIDDLYRPDAKVGSGSTADAARLEIATNHKIGGKWHLEKSQNTITFLERWLKNNPSANSSDRASIENIITDLKDAIGKKPWYSQTKPPKP